MSHLEQREASVSKRVGNCTVFTVTTMECRWVTDRRTKKGFAIFCGEPVVKPSRPYCAEHHALIYVKMEKKK